MNSHSYSINELISYLSSRESKLESVSSRKNYITFCNSVSIKLLQAHMYHQSLSISFKALSARKLLSNLSISDKLWPGQILTLNIISYIYYKIQKFTEALKTLYESQNLLQNTKETLNTFNTELYILTNFLTFLCLWKIDRKLESVPYLEIVKNSIDGIRKGKIFSKFSKSAIENFYGVVGYSLAKSKIEIEGNYQEAFQVLEKISKELQTEVVSRDLIRDLMQKIKALERNPYEEVDCDISGTDEIFFISLFIPLISPKTPEIRKNEVFRFSRNSSTGSKRSQSPSKTQEVQKSSLITSPCSRPKSNIRSEVISLTVYPRPKSSFGLVHLKRTKDRHFH